MDLTISTTDHWQQLERWLSLPHFSARLMADDTPITVVVERLSRNSIRYGLAVYIDGKIEWKNANSPDELTLKYWRPRTIRLYSPAKKASILKGVPKRQQAYITKNLGLDASRVMYSPIHNTFASLRRQLKQHAKTLQWLDAPQPQEQAL